MATQLNITASVWEAPRLHAGDRLTRGEFERRYAAMRDLKKAEFIEGVVYMTPPVSTIRTTLKVSDVDWCLRVGNAGSRSC